MNLAFKFKECQRGGYVLNKRQEKLLKIIVEDYIKTARPIGSKAICNELNCSSATVRNEMGELENLGLLEKMHTSSGRIPSEKGYRYYVDNIMKPKELNGEEMLKLQTIFKNNSLVLSDAIERSMEIISELTSYTSIVLGKQSNNNKVTKVEVVPITDTHLIALVVTDKGHVEHRDVIMSDSVDMKEITKTVEIINKMVIGTPINEVSAKLEYEVKPVINECIAQHDVLYNAFYNAFSDFNKSEVHMSGTSNILMQPEFDNADRIREIISKFDDKTKISNIKEDDSGINIYIGSENEFDDEVTIIKTKYSVNGEEGTIALIGPKRMEYERVVTLLDYIKKNIEG